jgi:methyl-galactoside transport system substrate-binding protein
MGGVKMKRIISLLLIASMLCCTATGCGSRTGARNVRIGCAIYKFDDTFVTTVRNYISEAAAGKAEVEIVDSQVEAATPSASELIKFTVKAKFAQPGA